MILKPFSFLPALAIMYLIFTFSSQTGEVSGALSYKVSYKVVQIAEAADQVIDLGIEPGNTDYYVEKIHPYIRKIAHMTEYFCLAVAVAFPFYVYGLRFFFLGLGSICSVVQQKSFTTMIPKNAPILSIPTSRREGPRPSTKD